MDDLKKQQLIFEDMWQGEKDTKENNATKVQNNTIFDQNMTMKKETMNAWGRRGSWLFQSVMSAAHQFIFFSFDIHPNVLFSLWLAMSS